jgi:hypothetical protein
MLLLKFPADATVNGSPDVEMLGSGIFGPGVGSLKRKPVIEATLHRGLKTVVVANSVCLRVLKVATITVRGSLGARDVLVQIMNNVEVRRLGSDIVYREEHICG